MSAPRTIPPDAEVWVKMSREYAAYAAYADAADAADDAYAADWRKKNRPLAKQLLQDFIRVLIRACEVQS